MKCRTRDGPIALHICFNCLVLHFPPPHFDAMFHCCIFSRPGTLSLIHITDDFLLLLQDAQLPQRQRVSYTRLSRLANWSCTSLNAASVVQLYNRLAKRVSTLSANKPCDISTLSWIGHSRSSSLVPTGIQIVCGRNVHLMPTLFLKSTNIWQRDNGKFGDFTDPTQVWRCSSKKRLQWGDWKCKPCQMQYHEKDGPNLTSGICKTWRMTDQIAPLEFARPGKWRTESQGLENAGPIRFLKIMYGFQP